MLTGMLLEDAEHKIFNDAYMGSLGTSQISLVALLRPVSYTPSQVAMDSMWTPQSPCGLPVDSF
jgi:hypothetical protein